MYSEPSEISKMKLLAKTVKMTLFSMQLSLRPENIMVFIHKT